MNQKALFPVVRTNRSAHDARTVNIPADMRMACDSLAN